MDNPNYIHDDDFIDRRNTEYAVIIYLPQKFDELAKPMREKYDPDYNTIPTHISLVFPFETTRSLEELSSIIGMEIDQLPAFDIELHSVADFYPSFPVIYWSLKKNEAICELYYRLYSRLEQPIPIKNYIPHVTIAKEISNHRVETVKDHIASYLPDETFRASSIDLVTPLINFRWVSVRSFSFNK